MPEFDVDGPATLDTLFGLQSHPNPKLRILSVPFDATTSSRPGTAGCLEGIVEASHQVDLHHPLVEAPWEAGIVLDAPPPWVEALSSATRELVLLHRDGAPGYANSIDEAGRRIVDLTYAWTRTQLESDVIPAILGGDHSVPQGAMRAALEEVPHLGVLQIDAHADLRQAYEGLRYSHASVFHNVLADGLECLVQVGIRDLCSAEARLQREDLRVHAYTDLAIADALGAGEGRVHDWLDRLPDAVWVSFDIDGLDPSLCPNTGTPVPGGLTWREIRRMLRVLGSSGKRIVGFDLCEVGVGDWDANVAARLLFELASWAIHTGAAGAAASTPGD